MIAVAAIEASEAALDSSLFRVWIDLNFGCGDPDWWWNSEPQKLFPALEETKKLRSKGWVCAVLIEGQNPRSDGRWDNP